MLIFDGFKSSDKAKEFAAHVGQMFGGKATVFVDQVSADKIDPFPFKLVPPIVQVDRGDDDFEEAVINSVPAFTGTFAGT